LSHVTNCVGIETYTKDHPAAAKGILDVVVTRDITESNSGKSLESPVEGHDILFSRIVILNSLGDNP